MSHNKTDATVLHFILQNYRNNSSWSWRKCYKPRGLVVLWRLRWLRHILCTRQSGMQPLSHVITPPSHLSCLSLLSTTKDSRNMERKPSAKRCFKLGQDLQLYHKQLSSSINITIIGGFSGMNLSLGHNTHCETDKQEKSSGGAGNT